MVYIIGTGDPIEVKGNLMKLIEHDRDLFRLNGDKNGLSVANLLIGEIQRDPNKDISDENITKILKNLRKTTMKLIDMTVEDPDNPTNDTLIIQMIDTYIPPPVSDQEVMDWAIRWYSKDQIKKMGKSAFRIIGEAKKHFGDREISVDALKKAIGDIVNV